MRRSAYLGHFDFIYCMPNVYLSIPFPMLGELHVSLKEDASLTEKIGIVTEAGSSVTFVRKRKSDGTGVCLRAADHCTSGDCESKRSSHLRKKAERARALRRKVHQVSPPCRNGPFLADPSPSKIFPEQPAESFHAAVRAHIQQELKGLDHSACLGVKQLIKAGLSESNNLDSVNLRESYAQSARIASGVPRQRFAQIARKEIKHKL